MNRVSKQIDEWRDLSSSLEAARPATNAALAAVQVLRETIGKELDFHPLGMLPDETFEEYRDNPGTLEERRHLSFFTFRQSAVASNSLLPPNCAQVFGKGFAGRCQKTKPNHAGGHMC